MSALNFVTGDATRPALRGGRAGPGVIAHVVNDKPAWGRGFVLALSAVYKEPEAAYRADPPRLGSVRIVQVSRQLYVANLCAQRGLPGRDNPQPLNMPALEGTLLTLRDFARREGASIHLPGSERASPAATGRTSRPCWRRTSGGSTSPSTTCRNHSSDLACSPPPGQPISAP